MSDMNKPNEQANSTSGETLSLNDDRRVKTLSPGALVVKRFFRNRLAVLGLVILAIMFLFSFVGGMISPYREDEQFYTYTYMEKEYVGVTRNEDFRYVSAEGADFGSAAQAQFLMAQMMGKTEFDYKDVTYGVAEEGKDFYSVSVDGSVIAIAYKDIVNAADNKEEPAFNVKYEALKLYTNDGTGSFTADGMELSLDEDGNILQGEEVLGYISRFVVQSKENGVVIPRDFKGCWMRRARNSPTRVRTVRSITIRSLMTPAPRSGPLCRRRRLMCTASMRLLPRSIRWVRIPTVWIC